MLNQKLKLKLSQKLSPQQIQLMKLIQLSTQEFEQKLLSEIEENPALDNTKIEETESDEIYDGEDFENDSNNLKDGSALENSKLLTNYLKENYSAKMDFSKASKFLKEILI